VVEDVLDLDAPRARFEEEGLEAARVEEVDVFRVVVLLRGHGRHDVLTRHAHGLGRRLARRLKVFEHFERSHNFGVAVFQLQRLRVQPQRPQVRDAAFADGGDVGDPHGVNVNGRHFQPRERIEERPEERAPPAAHVQQARRREAAEDPQHLAHAGQVRAALELVQAQAAREPRRDQLFVGEPRRGAAQLAAHVSGGEAREVAVIAVNCTGRFRHSAIIARVDLKS
jgi:hypothetical protein